MTWQEAVWGRIAEGVTGTFAWVRKKTASATASLFSMISKH